MNLWMVVYRVYGHVGQHVVGPYSDQELAVQRRDIATYMGVHDVRVLRAPAPKEVPHTEGAAR